MTRQQLERLEQEERDKRLVHDLTYVFFPKLFKNGMKRNRNEGR